VRVKVDNFGFPAAAPTHRIDNFVNSYKAPFFRKIWEMSKKGAITLSKVLDKYINIVSCEKKGWMQELYRANVIKNMSWQIKRCVK
jgi:hypothetical protein